MKTRELFLSTILHCLLIILPGCANTKPVHQTPAMTDIPQPEGLVTPTQAEPLGEFRIREADGMTMLYIPGGDFQMGSTETEIADALALCQQHYHICNRWYYEREGPQHAVTLDDYWIDQTEVRNAHYRLCVEAGICAEPSTCNKGTPTFADPGKADHPVVCVNWEEAQTYCQWAGGRLPTEAEWEYAFRGESGSIYSWGDEFDGSRLNYCDANCSQAYADDGFDDGYSLTSPAGSYPAGASWTGALDMGGNVTEWVADWFGDYALGNISNPPGPASGSERMLKGCSWFFPPAYCRGAARPSADPETRLDYLGFRCAVSANPILEEGANMTLNSIPVAPEDPPILDGTISPSEWDGATIESFADGSQLFLMRNGEFLYVGIRAKEPRTIAANIFIQRGDEISILHASAALGTAIYRRGEDGWQQVQDFTWRCRNTGSSEAAQAERAEFLQDEDWLAANSLMGTPNELEYQIEIPDQDFRLAAVYIKSTPPYEEIPWPGNLDDVCIRPTPGGIPSTILFKPEMWLLIRVEN